MPLEPDAYMERFVSSAAVGLVLGVSLRLAGRELEVPGSFRMLERCQMGKVLVENPPALSWFR